MERNTERSRTIQESIQEPIFNNHEISDLPGDVLGDIMSRLWVKTLSKCMCVSKPWCSFISSKLFLKTHVERSRKDSPLSSQRLFATFLANAYMINHCSLHHLLELDQQPVTCAVPFGNVSYSTLRLVGSCNGLICGLIDRKDFFLWNPTTGKSRKLPDLDADMKDGFVTKFGFGFVDDSCDFKVYGVFTTFWITGRHQKTGKVYSLSVDSWKTVEDFKDSSAFDEKGTFVCGNLHWTRKEVLGSTWDISSFDLQNETYGQIEQPRNLEGGYHMSLGVLDGCLCMLCDYQESRSDVWVLKKHGVAASWSKVVTISYLWNSWKGPLSAPLCMLPDQDVLFTCGSSFVVYSTRDSLFQYSKIKDFDGFLEADVFVESLASVEPGNEEQGREDREPDNGGQDREGQIHTMV